MTHCPNGHDVAAGLDYCEECGARVGQARPPAPAQPAKPAVASWTCAECDTVQSLSRFCEACGETNQDHPDYVQVPHSHEEPDTPHLPQEPAAEAPTTQWTVTAAADRAYFDRIQTLNGPDAPTLRFPLVYPPRKFQLENDQIFIGRHSRRRGIEPDIDLSAAPEDPGVSHAHAAIVATGPSSWALIDVGSANGTYLNESEDPVEPGTEVALKDGDRIHLGAWTVLTIALNGS